MLKLPAHGEAVHQHRAQDAGQDHSVGRVSSLPTALGADGCRLFASVHSSKIPDCWATTPSRGPFLDWEAKLANMPCIHCSPASQAEQCLGKGYLFYQVKGKVEARAKKPCSHIRPDEMPAVMLHSLQARSSFEFTSHLCILPVQCSS